MAMRSKALVNQFVAENLRTIRIAKGMKGQEVARRAGLADSSYSCLEGGWYKINLDNLFRILLVLDTDVSKVWPNGWISRLDDAAIKGLLDQARAQRPREISIQDVIDAVSSVYEVDFETLASRSRKRKLAEARAVAAILVKEIPQLSLTKLAGRLGVHISALSHHVKRMQEKETTDPALVSRIEACRKILLTEFGAGES